MYWGVSLAIAVVGAAIGAAFGAWLSSRTARVLLEGDLAARRAEARHERMLTASSDVLGAASTLATVVSTFAALPTFSKSARVYDFPAVLAPYHQTLLAASARLRPAADPSLRQVLDEVLDSTAALVTTATRQFKTRDVSAEQDEVNKATSALVRAITERAEVASFSSLLSDDATAGSWAPPNWSRRWVPFRRRFRYRDRR